MEVTCPFPYAGGTRIPTGSNVVCFESSHDQILMHTVTGEYKCIHGGKDNVRLGGPFTQAIDDGNLVLVGVGGELTGALILVDDLFVLKAWMAYKPGEAAASIIIQDSSDRANPPYWWFGARVIDVVPQCLLAKTTTGDPKIGVLWMVEPISLNGYQVS